MKMSEKESIEPKGIAEADTNDLTPNATTHSENTHKPSAFSGKILNLTLQLKNLGYSEAYLSGMVRLLNRIAEKQ